MKGKKTLILLGLVFLVAIAFGGGVFYGQYTMSQKGIVYTENKEESISQVVNINTADAEELSAVKGIGAVTAEKIVSSREKEGAFSSVEDLKTRGLMGEQKWSEVESFLTVE